MKKLLLLIALLSFTLADTLSISDDLSSVDTNIYQTTIEDKNKDMDVYDILKDRYKTNYFKDRTGATKSVFWTKVLVKNSTVKNMHIVFQNNRAGIDKIDVFIYKDRQLIHTHTLGDLRDQKLRAQVSPKSVFHLEFPANEEYTIISRFESMGPMNLSWQMLNEKMFSKKSNLEFLFNGLFAGVLIALIVYNFMLFTSLKEISFLLYVFLTSSLLWIQYTYSGMFYFLDIGINLSFLSISAWFVPYFYSGLLALFTIAFFKIHEKNRYVFYFFVGMSAIGFLFSFLSFFLFVNSDLAIYTPYSYIYFYLSLIFIFLYAIYATVKAHPFALYFLLGEGSYLVALFYSILVVSGTVKISNNLQFIVPSAMAIEVLLFSIALSKRVKLLKQSNDAREVLLVEESKFSAIGKGIGNVAHQWKAPLSQLNTHLLYLQGLYYVGDEKKLIEEFGSSIEKIGNTMNYMKGSIEELHDFYSDVETNTVFQIKKQIALAKSLQNDHLILNNIAVNVECDDDLSLIGAKHGLANILMILFDNSIYQFEKQKTSDAKIDIKVVKTDNHIKIHFKDNAGGTSVQPIEKIFDIHFSTKGDSGCGLGLSLAKELVKKALHGEISVKNRDDGIEFILTI